MAPVLSFTAAEAWVHLPSDPNREEDPALASFPEMNNQFSRADLDTVWERLIQIRRELTKALEIARADKVIGHSLEARVLVAVEGEVAEFLEDKWQVLQSIAIVSQLEQAYQLPEDHYQSELPGLAIMVEPSQGEKCERCWTRSTSVGDDQAHPLACERCVGVLAEIGNG